MKVTVFHLDVSDWEALEKNDEALNIYRKITALADAELIRECWIKGTRGFGPQGMFHYFKVAEVKTKSNTIVAAAEEAFEYTNHIDHSWKKNPQVTWSAITDCRSTSVGDVMMVEMSEESEHWRDVEVLFVDRVGFGEVYQ